MKTTTTTAARIHAARTARARMDAARKEAAAARKTWTAARAAAYAAAAADAGVDLKHDAELSKRAGYPVMMSADGMTWVSDLTARYELNCVDGTSRNYWTEDFERDAMKEAAVEAAAAAYAAARDALRGVDAVALNGDELMELCARQTARAIERRERDTAQDAAVMRQKYREDAEQETAAELLGMVSGAWIDGTSYVRPRDGGERVETPRCALSLSYVAAVAAGRALDRLIYADGGHAVKLSAREARKHYSDAPELRELSEAVRAAEAAEAAAVTEAERREAAAAVKTARRELSAAAGNYARGHTVTETRRTSSPVAPAPEAAALRVETVARVLDAVKPAFKANAARLLWEVYAGADSTRDAARRCGLSEAAARRAWHAVKDAAEAVRAEDGEAREALRDAERVDAFMDGVMDRKHSTDAARMDARLREANAAPADAPAAVDWTPARGKHARHAVDALRSMTYEDRLSNYSDFRLLCRLLWTADC